MMLFGTERDRTGGLLVIAFGLACMAAGLMPLFSRPASGRVVVDTIADGGSFHPAFIFRASQAKQRLAWLGCILFAGAGYEMLNSNMGARAQAAGLVTLIFFGGCAVVATPFLFQRVGSMALLPEGILWLSPWSSTFVPWQAIVGAVHYQIRGVPFLGLNVADRTLVRRRGAARLSSPVARKLNRCDEPIALNSFEVAPEVVAAAVECYIHEPEQRARIGTSEELARLLNQIERGATSQRAANADRRTRQHRVRSPMLTKPPQPWAGSASLT